MDETWFYVESDESKICYKVCYAVDGKENYCTCGDFAKGAKADPFFKCKHILAVIKRRRMKGGVATNKERLLPRRQDGEAAGRHSR